ncbi:CDK-activating kinase assembly factor MAT1-domain-containing protein [Gautieria morchelliformis]|nr:CDK-activating kinase assembly factor MAT1-domain-containing protein [Gautieria morchelliformis]
MSKAGGWLRGSTKRAGTSSALTSRPSASDATGKTAEFSSMDDQCPVCKSDRYLNPKLRLLVSSTCYHKMCESCIDRLFTLGPAPCPICTKVLRKLAFTPQTFEDLVVEKEVAVRRRISKEFNKRREDFVDLRSYNDYLEMVEDITFNLINEIDPAATEARIAAFRAENAALIQLNIQREKLDAQELQEDEERDRREREERMRELRREEEEERQEREKERRAIIDGLESGKEGSAARVIAKTRAEALKRTAARTASSSIPSQSKLLRSRAAIASTVPDVPHVPLTDDWYAYEDQYVRRTYYDDPSSVAVRADREGLMRAGGYCVDEVWERAIRMAVAGLEISPSQGVADATMGSA